MPEIGELDKQKHWKLKYYKKYRATDAYSLNVEEIFKKKKTKKGDII